MRARLGRDASPCLPPLICANLRNLWTNWIEIDQATDSEATLASLPPGTTIKVRILAANKAGDSTPGDPAQIIVP
ncbi:MAG: fibronectin type III domain-containing protein [Terrimicrobiaceae bacterium]|nr:fibronectin type III domain-containing protein [Terrimicrobiaceae bacterium]